MALTFPLATEQIIRFSRVPALLAAYVTETTTGNRSTDGDNVQVVYRGKLFAVVDDMIGELDRRFTNNDELLHAMAACDPHSPSYLSALSLRLFIG
jgi:hypothetical protein